MMRQIVRLVGLLGIFALVAVVGCGGGNSGNGGNAGPSPFGGTWIGTWADAVQSGTLNVTVVQDGTITGTVVNNTLGITGTVGGSTTNAGVVTSTYNYPGRPIIQANGNVAIAQNGHWTGSVTEIASGHTLGVATLDLIKQ
jgi:hypothetical protein